MELKCTNKLLSGEVILTLNLLESLFGKDKLPIVQMKWKTQKVFPYIFCMYSECAAGLPQ